ncbi:MAG: AsmA family protein [Limisphaerales bacterium]
MKKLIIRLLIALIVVVALAVLAVGLFLDGAIKRGVETFGPKLTKVDIKLQSVKLSLLSGGCTINGLVVGNPEGFKTPSAISVGEATLALEPSSLLSDKIIIKTINVQAPDITFETDLKHNNLSKILSNVQEATGGGGNQPAKPQEPPQPNEAKPAKKLQVDEFVITGGKIHVSVTGLVQGTATVPLPDIHLQDLGTGPDGITPAELTKQVLEAIEKGATRAASGAVTDISKGAVYITKDPGNAGSNALQNVTKGLGSFLKKN